MENRSLYCNANAIVIFCNLCMTANVPVLPLDSHLSATSLWVSRSAAPTPPKNMGKQCGVH